VIMSSVKIREFNLSIDGPETAKLYRACFYENPWYEKFAEGEIEAMFTEMMSYRGLSCLVAENAGQIVGGTAGFDLSCKKDVLDLLDQEISHVFYMAELFVSSNYRRAGIAEALVRARFDWARILGYSIGVVRTSIQQSIIIEMYYRRGFTVVATQDVVSDKWIAGTIQRVPDTRVIMKGKF